MASSDAKPIPIKNAAYRVTFPIYDADGDLVTGAAALDSEVSKDGGTFADCTNEATEIATASGMYFLDLTATEMNADTVAIIVKTTTTGAKTTPIILYPNEVGDIGVNVQQISGDTVAADNCESFFDGTGYAGTGNTIPTVTAVTNTVNANAVQISGDTTAADNCESFFDGTGYAGTGNTIPTVTSVTNTVNANAVQISGDTNAADNCESFFDGTGYAGTGNTIPTVTTVSGNVSGNVVGSVGSLAAQAKADVNAEVVDALVTDTYAEPASVPAATSSLKDKIAWLFSLARNKKTQTATTHTLRNDADSANIATSTVSDDGTTHTSGEWT